MREGGRASAASIPLGGSPPTLRSERRRQSLGLCATCQTADVIFERECFDCALSRLARLLGGTVTTSMSADAVDNQSVPAPAWS